MFSTITDARTDDVLVVAAKSGNERAFEFLFDRHHKRILAIALRYTRVLEDAEDVVQQAFQKAFVHLYEFEGKSSFSTWLTRITINEALMALRRGRAAREVSIDEFPRVQEGAPCGELADLSADPETTSLWRERRRLLCAAIDKLRPNLRKAIELRELRELSAREAAERLGLTVVALKGRLFHAKKKLRLSLTQYLRSPRACRREAFTGTEDDVSRTPVRLCAAFRCTFRSMNVVDFSRRLRGFC